MAGTTLAADIRSGSARSAVEVELGPAAVAARLRRARRRGHPGYVWPDVPMRDWRASLHAIQRALAAALADDADAVALAAPAGARALGIAAFTSGTGPLLGLWLESGRVATDAATEDVLATHLDHARARTRRLAGDRARAVATLHGAGVPAVLLKGAHTAWAFFPDPCARPMADIDIAVATADVPAARAGLARAGYAESLQTRRPYRADWVPAGTPREPRSLDLTHRDNPCAIEVHGSLARDLGVRRLDPGPLDVATTAAPAFHAGARVLREPYLTTFLALHASEALHNLTMIRLVELALVIRQGTATGALNWNDFLDLLERDDALRFVYPALRLTHALAPGAIDGAVLRRAAAGAPPRMRRVVDALAPADAQRAAGVSLAERFMAAVGPREHIRRVAFSVLPVLAGGGGARMRRLYYDRFFRILRGTVSPGGRQ